MKGAWSLKGKTFSPMMHYFHVTGLVADKSFEKKHGTPKGKYIYPERTLLKLKKEK
ncbi:hypothetical protein [Methanobacterium sp.]|uniref:hypothetical protein n=1 Tax=Methanobacterium sp. TaxID=2164 RepID=UPI002AB9AF89|nr:hypothetical protein [Methanobacterium sp.]MDY9923335.1 hypothetical protein [Methanobacterium sp.]